MGKGSDAKRGHPEGPLEGLTVVALEQAVAAPYCTLRLADAGARVIKVERARGDSARGFDEAVEGLSSYFVWLNRGKESIVLDIKAERDAGLLDRMIAGADVFVQNLAPGSAARAGFGAEELRRRHPRLVTVDITGYPAGCGYAERKAYDLLVQAETGLASVSGRPEGAGRVGVSVCDIACGLNAYAATLEALLARETSGLGAAISVSLFECMADWMAVPYLFERHGGGAPRRLGLRHPSIHPYGAYDASTGPAVVVAVQNDDEFTRLCEAVLGLPEVARDERFATNPLRCRHRDELDELLEPAFARLDRAELLGRLETARIAWGEVNDVEGLARHPALATTRVVTPEGEVELPVPPGRRAWAGRRAGRVPEVDADGDRLRREFGAPAGDSR